MRIEVAAKRYAQAAFDIARERNEFDRWVEDLGAIVDLAAQPGVVDVLASSRVPFEGKERLLSSGLVGISPLALNLARLLVKKGRIAMAGQVRDEYLGLLDEHRGMAKAVVLTAVPLSDDEERAVAQRLRETDRQGGHAGRAGRPGDPGRARSLVSATASSTAAPAPDCWSCVAGWPARRRHRGGRNRG